MSRTRLFFTTLMVMVLTLVGSSFAQGIPREVRQRILEAVVQIIPWDATAGEFAPWSGSGTIISPDGYILTNFHVIGDLDTRRHFDFHAIFMSDPNFTDQPPEPRYWAQYVDSDPTHDLAILKIVEFIDETPVPADLTFTSVEVGDSNDLFPGDTITIVGYPGISGSTITFTAGLMSGWLGEDFESGGKQWVKTDAKISHGNSGGAAFNSQGQLIGVPTAGITVEYEELDVEEQAYVRPISLAWAVIGPNVANVTRAGGVTTTPPPPPPDTGTITASSAGTPSGEYGSIAVGQQVTGTIAAIPDADSLVYHTYVVEVPAGTPSLTITVQGNGADLDLAVKVGSPITGYGDGEVDHLDVSEEPNPSYVIQNPAPGPVYIDVLNLLPNAADYSVSVSGGGSTVGATTPPAGGESGDYGAVTIGLPVNNAIAAIPDADSLVYHGYVVEVPAGTPSLTITVQGNGADLDLAVKVGSPITGYGDGEVDHLDVSEEPNPSYVIQNPAPGPVYIDVLNLLTNPANYTLSVTSGGGNPLGGGQNPLGGGLSPITANTTGSGIVGDLAIGQPASGTLTGEEGASSYHTYVLAVPQGTARITIRMEADQDLDMAAKFGSEILSYAEDGGDYQYMDNSLEPTAVFVIDNPQPGQWFIDVFNALGPSTTGSYNLIVE